MDEKTEKKNDIEEEAPEFSKVVLGLAVAVLVLGGIIYAGYTYSQKKAGKTVYPAGYPIGQQPAATAKNWTQIDCNTEKYNPADPWPYILKCDRFKTDANAKWVPYTDKGGRFTVQLPSTLKTIEYSNGLGVVYKDVTNAASNLLLSLDIAASRSGEFKNLKGEEYVKNYWRQYSGLSGLQSFEVIKNTNDEKGYKAVYKLSNNIPSPAIEIFFELPGGEAGDFVHFSSGVLDDTVFNTIVGSYKSTVNVTPKPTK